MRVLVRVCVYACICVCEPRDCAITITPKHDELGRQSSNGQKQEHRGSRPAGRCPSPPRAVTGAGGCRGGGWQRAAPGPVAHGRRPDHGPFDVRRQRIRSGRGERQDAPGYFRAREGRRPSRLRRPRDGPLVKARAIRCITRARRRCGACENAVQVGGAGRLVSTKQAAHVYGYTLGSMYVRMYARMHAYINTYTYYLGGRGAPKILGRGGVGWRETEKVGDVSQCAGDGTTKVEGSRSLCKLECEVTCDLARWRCLLCAEYSVGGHRLVLSRAISAGGQAGRLARVQASSLERHGFFKEKIRALPEEDEKEKKHSPFILTLATMLPRRTSQSPWPYPGRKTGTVIWHSYTAA